MTNPTQITTPGGTRLTVPLAWTCWTYQNRMFRRDGDGEVWCLVGYVRHRWTGRRWEPVQAQARFLEVV